MKIITVPVWNKRVSNVFDFANMLMLLEVDNGVESRRLNVSLENQSLRQRVRKLKSFETDILICGAISRELADMVTSSGIQLLPYVTGYVDDVLQAYLTGQLAQPRFIMAGYWPGARKGFGRCRHRHRHGY